MIYHISYIIYDNIRCRSIPGTFGQVDLAFPSTTESKNNDPGVLIIGTREHEDSQSPGSNIYIDNIM